MRLDKVYVGRTEDGKERVFQKKYKENDSCSYSVYTDLKTGEDFTLINIESDTLVSYKSLYSTKKYGLKRKVIKSYKCDSQPIYHVDNLFLGNIYKVDWIPNSLTPTLPMDVSFKEGNRLFVRLGNGEFKDLRTKKVYRKLGHDTLMIGDLCVSDLRNANEILKLSFDGSLVSRQYVLRKHYQKYNKK